MPFVLPECWGPRVYLEVGEVRYRSLKAQAAKPTNVLNVRGQVWMCLDNGKGGNYLFQEHILPRGLNFETGTGSILLDIFWLDCDKNRASDITWEVRQPEKIDKLERRKQGLEERGERI